MTQPEIPKELEFFRSYKNYRLYSCTRPYCQFSTDKPNATIDLVQIKEYDDGIRYTFLLAYLVYESGECRLHIINSKFFEQMADKDVEHIWDILQEARCALSEWEKSLRTA